MALRPFYLKKEEVPQALADEYKEFTPEGAEAPIYLLDVTETAGFALENVAGLKSAFSREKEERRTAKAKLEKFGELDPDTVTAKLTELEELKKLDPKSEAGKIAASQIEALKKEMGTLHKTEVTKIKANETKWKGRVEKLMVDDQIRAAIARQKGSVELLLPIMRGKVVVREVGDELEVVVNDEAGNPRIGDASGTKLFSIDQLAEELKADKVYAPAFAGTNAGGSGTPTTIKSPGGASGDNLSSMDKIEAGLQERNLT